MVAVSSTHNSVSPEKPFRAAPGARELPHDDLVEERFLACTFLDGPTIIPKAIVAGIGPDSFYISGNAVVFSVVMDLWTNQKPTTLDMVAAELKRRKELEPLGGYPFLVQISQTVPTIAEAEGFIQSIRSYAVRRAIIQTRTRSVEQAYTATGDIDELVASLTASEQAVLGDSSQNNEETVPEVCTSLLRELDLPKNQRNGSAGEISWTLVDMDRQCGKLAAGTLNILAALPSGGKSALAQQVAWGCCRQGLPAVYFSYEMLKKDVVVRIAQQESRLNLGQFDDSPMDVKLRFTTAIREIQTCKHLHILERDITVNRIVARCRTLHRKHRLGVIVVDFLQYLSRLEPTIGKERTDEKLGRITAALKNLGKECECPVLLLSSLNREGYKNGGKPGLASLRSSGEIESDADVVMLLHWPKSDPFTGHDQDPHDSTQNRFLVEAMQEKGRSRGVHQVNLSFDRMATRFDNHMR